MIVLKHNGVVYVARSSWGISDIESKISGKPIPENVAIWHPSGKRDRLIAMDGIGRFTDMVRYASVFPKHLDGKHLFLDTYDKLSGMAARYGLYCKNSLPNDFVFAEGDRAFVLHADGAVYEIEDMHCDSIYGSMLVGLYDKLGADDPRELIREAFRLQEVYSRSVMFPVVMMSTASGKIEVINR